MAGHLLKFNSRQTYISGLGMGMVLATAYSCVYYNVIVMWTLYYLFSSFAKQLPWAHCGNPWNTDKCRLLGSIGEIKRTHTVILVENVSGIQIIV